MNVKAAKRDDNTIHKKGERKKNVGAAIENGQLRKRTSRNGVETPKRKNDGGSGRDAPAPKRLKLQENPDQSTEQHISTERHVIQTTDKQSVEIVLSKISLRIKFDIGLSYEMNLTRPVGAKEKQALLNRLRKSTMNEFREQASMAFNGKRRRTVEKMASPIIANETKLNNFKLISNAIYYICGNMLKVHNMCIRCAEEFDCIQFTWHPSKQVVITNRMVIRISLPLFDLEYEIKPTHEITSLAIMNLLKFVDQSGKEEWLNLTQRHIVDLLIHSKSAEENYSIFKG